jgi:hypothetical protein
VPGGSSTYTAVSFTEFRAGVSGAAALSCSVWANAFAQAKAHASTAVIAILAIAPAALVLPLFAMNAVEKTRFQYGVR